MPLQAQAVTGLTADDTEPASRNRRREVDTMATETGGLTLELDAAFERRIEAMAALKGVSAREYWREYCWAAINGKLARDEVEDAGGRGLDRQAFERLVARRDEIFGDRTLSRDSVDLIREGREIR